MQLKMLPEVASAARTEINFFSFIDISAGILDSLRQ